MGSMSKKEEKKVMKNINRVDITDGSLVCFQASTYSAFQALQSNHGFINNLGAHVRDQGGTLIVLPPDIRVREIPEENMNMLGWYRKDDESKDNDKE